MRRFKLFRIAILAIAVISFCEYFIYYIVLFQCSWPNTSNYKSSVSIKPEDSRESDSNESTGNILRAMFLADTHLLGPVRGHWFDKLRREWQMYRAFQTAIHLFQPEVVFFLGDIFDEGDWVSGDYFKQYTERFHALFEVPKVTKTFVIAGNHDMGFHYRISVSMKKRFEKAFQATAVRRIRLKGVNFILLNSMALEGDNCFLCKPAVDKIKILSRDLDCERDFNSSMCVKSQPPMTYSQPILLQHFPLYRESDANCSGDDAAPGSERKFRPRLVLSGHTHHGCLYNHNVTYGQPLPEYSIPSFNWRNRNNPSFFLGLLTNDHYELSKCYLPKESTVQLIYVIATIVMMFSLFSHLSLNRRWRFVL